MKTIEQMQSAVDEIREVCLKHGVVLLGTCERECIYGEITITENIRGSCDWADPDNAADNEVFANGRDFTLGGIGDFVG